MRISDWSSDVCSSDLLASDRGVIFLSGNGGHGSIHGSVRWPDPVCIRLIRQFGINDDLVPQSAAKRRIFGIGQAGVQRRQVLVRIAVASACRQRQRQGEGGGQGRSEEHTSELQSLMRIPYAVFCLKQNNNKERASTT